MKKKLGLLLILAVSLLLLAVTAVSATANESVTVRFYLDEEKTQLYDEQTIPNDSYVSIPITPAKNGSIFEGWNDTDGNPFSFTVRLNADTDIIARWDEKEVFHTVIFKSGDNVISRQDVKSGEAAIPPSNVATPEGKRFAGWDSNSYTEVNSDMTVNAVLEDAEFSVYITDFFGDIIDTKTVKYSGSVDLSSIIPEEIDGYTFSHFDGVTENIREDGIISLVYTPDTYTVNFVSDGSAFASDEEVEHGKTVPFPKSNPVKENYIFIGWYKDIDSNEMYNFNDTVTESFTLYAKFIVIKNPEYSVRFFDYNGELYGGIQSVEKGRDAIEPGRPYREGYTFIGWSRDFTGITEDIDVHPMYEAKKYTVIIEDAEGELVRYNTVYGGSVKEPDPSEIRVPEGYEFLCWDSDFKSIIGDKVIKAKYRKLSFDVMFGFVDSDGAVKLIGVPQRVEYAGAAILPNPPAKTGYEFIGWTGGDPSSIKATTLLMAEYRRIEYTVDFFAEDGKTKVNTYTVYHGDLASIFEYNAFDKEAYIFGGWYTDNACTEAYDFSSPVTESITLYAKLNVRPKEVFTVKYYASAEDMQNGKTYYTLTVEKGASAVLTANPAKDGYTFAVWLDITGAEANLSSITADISVIASYNINKYNVIFNYSDGKTYTQSVEYGKAATPPSDTDKMGYTFKGWDAEYGSIISDITVNAVYEINVYEVKFLDGDDVLAIQSVEFGATARMIDVPVKQGYKFLKWITSSGDVFEFSKPIEGDTEVHAEFEKNKYTVSFYINGELYRTERLEFGAKIEIEDPVFENPDTVFLGWDEYPETVPAENITVMGRSYTYGTYDVIYMAGGEEFFRVSVKENQKIPAFDDIPSIDGKEFLYWEKLDSDIMPNHDVIVNAVFRELVNNRVVVSTSANGNSLLITVSVTDNVNFGGILGGFAFADNIKGYKGELGQEGLVYADGSRLNFVWSRGENTTLSGTLFTCSVECENEPELLKLEIIDMMAFDENGNIIDVDFTIIINK